MRRAAPCGVTADEEAHQEKARSRDPQTETKLGPVVKPTTPMNTARPTVSKTQSAGSGMRPKVGRTERSHANASPMIREPPLTARLSGKPPALTDSKPINPPTEMLRPTSASLLNS